MSTLNELLKEYELKRLNSYNSFLEKRISLYKVAPRIQEIDELLDVTSINTAKLIINNPDKKLVEELKQNISALKKEKEQILIELGKPKDYLIQTYDCFKCKDTGYILENSRTTKCSCLTQKLFDIEFNKANISNLEKENFDNFNLELYSDKIDEKKYGTTISPRENMKDIKDSIQNFIDTFDNLDEKNLIFSGGTGLGKTFLSNCIVNELLKKGKTVLYQTAPVMLDTVISDMFSKNTSKDSLSKLLLTVDLLIIDDLGTETMNSMKFTELYKIINTRLLNQNGKATKTIISTNLGLQDMFRVYDERLVSRFVGYYNIYRFFGDDIRFMA